MAERDDDAAARAYAAISEQLKMWTSPNLETSDSARYPPNALEWMEDVTRDEESMNMDVDGRHEGMLTPVKRSSSEGTPVMSNSAKRQPPRGPSPLLLTNTSNSFLNSTSTTATNVDTQDCRRYHDVLYSYLAARRHLSNRFQLAQAQELAALVEEEAAVERDYLGGLASLSFGEEQHVWSLLTTLRDLGMDALLWEQQTPRMSSSTSTTGSRLEPSAGEILEALYESNRTMQRRKAILHWLEHWQEGHIENLTIPNKRTTMWPDSLQALQQSSNVHNPHKIRSLHPDAPLLVSDTTESPLYGKDNDQEHRLLTACLAYIRAGRLDHAMALCQQRGQPWRCASWSGGQLNNPQRSLWKRTCWKLATSLSIPEEQAIYAFFSNHVQLALTNPSWRSWEGALQLGFHAMLQRMEDQALHTHYPSPTSQEHLQQTAAVATWNEAILLQTLASSPFHELQTSNPLRGAIASFLIAKQTVSVYIIEESDPGAMVDNAMDEVRFLTHLVLYLDSLEASSADVHFEDMDSIKNQVVSEYLRRLASRPDLWTTMVLYASLLPSDAIVQLFPSMLVPIEASSERALLVKQMSNLFETDLDLIVLRKLVRLLLTDDRRQLRSITWLCYTKEHLGEALVCTNALLRQLILSGDIDKAMVFLENYLPEQLGAMLQDDEDSVQEDDNSMQDDLADNARLEFGALKCYLEANKAYQQWEKVMADKSYKTTTSTATIANKAAFNATEMEIAASMEKRDFIQQKRLTSGQLAEAANSARNKLSKVLLYCGGWLLEEDDDHDGMDEEEKVRRQEMDALHSSCIPRTVFLLHTVCDETATWMEKSLNDAISILGKTALSVLDNAVNLSLSPLSPLYWIRENMSLAETVAAEEYGILEAFSPEERGKILSLMAETTIRELQQTSITNT